MILGHCNNPVSYFQAGVCGRGICSRPEELDRKAVLGCCNVRESSWHALERGYLVNLCTLQWKFLSKGASIYDVCSGQGEGVPKKQTKVTKLAEFCMWRGVSGSENSKLFTDVIYGSPLKDRANTASLLTLAAAACFTQPHWEKYELLSSLVILVTDPSRLGRFIPKQ